MKQVIRSDTASTRIQFIPFMNDIRDEKNSRII